MPSVRPTSSSARETRESGQAAVEAALTLPLVLFMVLGTLQLFLMFNARILTQLAAYRAARAGSVNHGNCTRMVDAALLQVMPAIESFMRPGPLSAGQKLAAAYARRRFNAYNDQLSDGGKAITVTGTVVWIVRDVGPRPSAGAQDDDFDMGLPVQRLETQVIFWFPMRIPFANWVMSKALLAHYGVQNYTAVNPLMTPQTAGWSSKGATSLNAAIIGEMALRMNRGEFVFPISATYTMRMMTPLKSTNFIFKNCAPTPNSI
ncbi:MAG: pilus assembly protein [Myxococcaceae bacterium]|nr:pilus assembly protein [Myxococcaceae bacterium]